MMILAVFLAPSAAAATGDGMPAIDDKKTGAKSNSVTMTLEQNGNGGPISAVVVQHGSDVVLQIVLGVSTSAKPVAVDRGTCAKLGPADYRLPPFVGGQYVATLRKATLPGLEDGNHAVVVYGARRSVYACGDLVKPNIFRH